jgi:vacuolar-type H+-ATPase subunit H
VADILGAQRVGAVAPRAYNIVKSNDPTRPTSEPADAAITRVLQAERDARDSIDQSHREAAHIAESARADARAVAERTERRIRTVVGAFEQQLAGRLAAIDDEATHMTKPHVLGDAELRALDLAVHALAHELTGAAP